MKKNIRYTFLLIMFFTLSCATSNQDKKYLSDCDSKTGILKTYGDTIRIEYNLKNKEEVDQIANEYCKKRSKVAKENQVACDGCCRVTFICKLDEIQ